MKSNNKCVAIWRPQWVVLWLAALSTGYLVGLGVCMLLTAVVLFAYTETALFLVQHYENWRPKDKALQLLGLYPVSLT